MRVRPALASVERVSELSLVDWRVRVADLYAQVRADDDPARAHATWRAGRDRLLREHQQSPLPAHDPLRETGLPVWDYDAAWRFEVRLDPPVTATDLDPDERDVDTGDDGTLSMRRVARLELPVGGGLDVWSLHQYGGGLFVPVKDATAGSSTYGAGRYLLDTAKGAWLGGSDDTVVVDLNFAYHPSCRYHPRWRCPLAPPGNVLDVEVRAGERLP